VFQIKAHKNQCCRYWSHDYNHRFYYCCCCTGVINNWSWWHDILRPWVQQHKVSRV